MSLILIILILVVLLGAAAPITAVVLDGAEHTTAADCSDWC